MILSVRPIFMHLEIDTTNKDLLIELVGKPPFRQVGESIPAPDGVSLVYEGMIERRGLDFPTTVQFLVQHIDDVAIALFSSWLYDKLKDRARRLRANGQEIQLTPEAVRRIFERHTKNR